MNTTTTPATVKSVELTTTEEIANALHFAAMHGMYNANGHVTHSVSPPVVVVRQDGQIGATFDVVYIDPTQGAGGSSS